MLKEISVCFPGASFIMCWSVLWGYHQFCCDFFLFFQYKLRVCLWCFRLYLHCPPLPSPFTAGHKSMREVATSVVQRTGTLSHSLVICVKLCSSKSPIKALSSRKTACLTAQDAVQEKGLKRKTQCD